jgi:hypothetical protein
MAIPLIIAMQRLNKHISIALNRNNNRRIAGWMFLWVSLCIPLSLLGTNSVKMFLQQQITARGSFLCSPCCIKGKQVIRSTQNFLLYILIFIQCYMVKTKVIQLNEFCNLGRVPVFLYDDPYLRKLIRLNYSSIQSIALIWTK